jgi:hypothetical protein
MKKIKSQNLLRLLLLTPYVAWGMAVLFSRLVYGPAKNPNTPNAILNALAGASTVYAVGIILWGIPYTLLALGLLIWSRKKSASVIYKVFLFSPVLLSLLMAVEAALVSFSPQQSTLINLQNCLHYRCLPPLQIREPPEYVQGRNRTQPGVISVQSAPFYPHDHSTHLPNNRTTI